MANTFARTTPTHAAVDEYTPGYEEWTRSWMQKRTALSHAGFLLPHLNQRARLLDCGCGPGSITLSLAELLKGGEVIGIDIEPGQVEEARADAARRDATNARFSVADVYALPFQDASFDVVFAHALLMH
ncbi:MAG TPA: class I SAM-dependent methyltransferase, partial [Pyrinomonadaceae bacterium]|nr:class I SAM-dependent methyltransferase [Pyrinomonadaceae bacterium]